MTIFTIFNTKLVNCFINRNLEVRLESFFMKNRYVSQMRLAKLIALVPTVQQGLFQISIEGKRVNELSQQSINLCSKVVSFTWLRNQSN